MCWLTVGYSNQLACGAKSSIDYSWSGMKDDAQSLRMDRHVEVEVPCVLVLALIQEQSTET